MTAPANLTPRITALNSDRELLPGDTCAPVTRKEIRAATGRARLLKPVVTSERPTTSRAGPNPREERPHSTPRPPPRRSGRVRQDSWSVGGTNRRDEHHPQHPADAAGRGGDQNLEQSSADRSPADECRKANGDREQDDGKTEERQQDDHDRVVGGVNPRPGAAVASGKWANRDTHAGRPRCPATCRRGHVGSKRSACSQRATGGESDRDGRPPSPRSPRRRLAPYAGDAGSSACS